MINSPQDSLTEAVERHQSLMASLAARHAVLLPLLRGRRLHYLDVPMYGNVGDLLIMLGTLSFFESQQLNVTRLGMYFNYSSRWAGPDDVMVFQGGGNFGDIYGPFQSFRERIVKELPNNRVVILPQTIHFSSPQCFEECCRVMSRHKDLHICVRDAKSADMAREMTKNVYLLPDMAHQLWPIGRTQLPELSVLKFLRRDGEAANAPGEQSGSFDWIDLVGPVWTFLLSQVAERCMYHATRFGLNKPFATLEARIWISQARRFVDDAVRLFSKYERIDSDRLHAHILACLLSIPHRVGDNSYGKNRAYVEEWTKGSGLVELVSNERLFD